MEVEVGGERLDKFISGKVIFSRSLIQGLIKSGGVEVNGKVITNQRHTLSSGDVINLLEDPVKESEVIEAREMPLDIIYEDDDLIIIDKAAGQVVHPGNGTSDDTMVHALLSHCKLSYAGGEKRPGVVHRLDQDTSGLIIFAKSDQAYFELVRMFSERLVEKFYYAISYGLPNLRAGVIEEPIGRHLKRRTFMCVREDGKYARTDWLVKSINKDMGITLFECKPHTGRTHQIRVHLKHLGYPIVGDSRYARDFINCSKFNELKSLNLMLHAFQLKFLHPISQKPILLKSEFKRAKDKLFTNLK